MNHITVNDLIKTLSYLPDEAKNMEIHNICGCIDGKDRLGGFQIQLKNDTHRDKYVIVPYNRSDIMYDSFEKREIVK